MSHTSSCVACHTLAAAAVALLAACASSVDRTRDDATTDACTGQFYRTCGCANGVVGSQYVCPSGAPITPCSCDAQRCGPDSVVACDCANGLTGTTTCDDQGRVEPCACGPAPVDGGRPPLDAASPTDADAPDGGSSARVVRTGRDALIDLFPVADGLIVVRSTRVERLDATGTVAVSLASPREITAAAFDGTTLAVADRALITVYDVDLAMERTIPLTLGCESAVMASGPRMVCGSHASADQQFTVYDLTSSTTAATTSPVLYEGVSLRRVPGTDTFITTTSDLSPSSYYLHVVAADGGVTTVATNAFDSIAATEVFAFDADPALHLINELGAVLRIDPGSCRGTDAGACFTTAAQVGTLATDQHFAAMADDGAGVLYGVVPTDGMSFDPSICGNGCLVQQIDLHAHLIRDQRPYIAVMGRVIVARFDPFANRFVLGYALDTYPMDPPGFQIDAFAF